MLAHEITTIDKLLEVWDAGETIWSIELGGLGPGYEQAIQVAAVEFARGSRDIPPAEGVEDEDARRAWLDSCEKVLSTFDKSLGLTGAMFSAASWLAYRWVHGGGPAKLIEETPKDRHIQVCKNWPKAA